MTDTKRYDLMMEVLNELAPEIRAARSISVPLRPPLRTVLHEFLPLPSRSVFLGIATDGFPVLLNLTDSLPGPLLIAGDAGSGKTSLLHVIARAVEECSEARDLQYGVITGKPEEWAGLLASSHRVDVFPSSGDDAQDFVRSMDGWAHSNRNDRQSLLLLIDDLSSLMNMDSEALQSLRWLLLRGPSRKVWPIVTINPKRIPDVHLWTSFFHTRLFGHTRAHQEVGILTDGARPHLEGLEAGTEFMMREGSGWLKFWIPSLD